MHEKTLTSKLIFEGLIFNLERHEVELADGTQSLRDIIRHGGAVGVIAQLPDKRHIFVRQYRKAIEQVTLEIVAGTLAPNENPAVCAERELIEESGYHPRNLHHLGTIHPSPGYISERIELYHAQVDPTPGAQALDDDERVEVELLSNDEVEQRIRNGTITDAKTLAAWTHFLLASSSGN